MREALEEILRLLMRQGVLGDFARDRQMAEVARHALGEGEGVASAWSLSLIEELTEEMAVPPSMAIQSKWALVLDKNVNALIHSRVSLAIGNARQLASRARTDERDRCYAAVEALAQAIRSGAKL